MNAKSWNGLINENPDVAMEIDRNFAAEDDNALEMCDAVCEISTVINRLNLVDPRYAAMVQRINTLAAKVCQSRDQGAANPPSVEPPLHELYHELQRACPGRTVAIERTTRRSTSSLNATGYYAHIHFAGACITKLARLSRVAVRDAIAEYRRRKEFEEFKAKQVLAAAEALAPATAGNPEDQHEVGERWDGLS